MNVFWNVIGNYMKKLSIRKVIISKIIGIRGKKPSIIISLVLQQDAKICWLKIPMLNFMVFVKDLQ